MLQLSKFASGLRGQVHKLVSKNEMYKVITITDGLPTIAKKPVADSIPWKSLRCKINQKAESNRVSRTSSQPQKSMIERLSQTVEFKSRTFRTPRRTYSKAVGRYRDSMLSPNLTKRHDSLFRNFHRREVDTQGCYGDVLIGIQKMPTIVDDKVMISPAQFKKQIKYWSDITSARASRDPMKNAMAGGLTYNDGCLFTNTMTARCYSDSLRRQFHRKCVHKVKPVDESLAKAILFD